MSADPHPGLVVVAATATACAACRTAAAPCAACGPGEALAGGLAAAFQPIVVLRRGRAAVFAYEALVRGPAGEPAGVVLEALHAAADPHLVDLACRFAGLRAAAAAGLPGSGARLSLNVLPNATLRPDTCLEATLAAARRFGLPPDRLVFEITEAEQVRDPARLRAAVAAPRARGVTVALDDFGAGYAGLGLLVELRPDIVKLDRALVRGIDRDPVRRRIAGAIARACRGLAITVIGEGVETADELAALQALGIRHVQGYLLARPALGALPAVAAVPAATAGRAAAAAG